MYLNQGKKYTCIKKSAYDFVVGRQYLAITSHQLLDKNAVPFDVTEWCEESFVEYFEIVNETKDCKIECFDAIKTLYDRETFKGFCLGNALNCIMSCQSNDNFITDITMARFYLDEIIKLYETRTS